MPPTVEFQADNPDASVNTGQTVSAVAPITI
jgi:hypothetical protein